VFNLEMEEQPPPLLVIGLGKGGDLGD